MQVQLDRWGAGLGIRIPAEFAACLGLSEGSRVDVTTDGERIVISAKPPVYTLDELLVGMTPRAMHQAFDWGPSKGNEIV
jgi:antitoxin component of MazEF toxin-antitoxin module